MILRLAAMAAAVTFLSACATTGTPQATAPAAPAATTSTAAAAPSASGTSASSAGQAQAASNEGRRCENVTGTRVKTACSNAPIQTGNQDTARQLQDRPVPYRQP